MKTRFHTAGRVSLILLIVIVALVAAGAWYFREAGASNTMRADLERELSQAAAASRANAAKALTAAEPERGKLAAMAISKEVFSAALKTAEGISFTEPATQLGVKIEKVTADFGLAFPKVKAVLRGSWQGQSVDFEAEGVLKHELGASGVKLKFVVLGVAPKLALPSGLKAITSAQLTKKLNDLIPPFDAPLPGSLEFAPEVKPIEDFWVNVLSGKVKLHIAVPALPPLKVNWQPVAVFFDESGLRVLARVSTSGPLPLPAADTAPTPSGVPSDDELRAQFAKWPGLREGQSYSVSVPSNALTSTIQTLALPTVKVDSVGTEGNLMEKTGGLPFGNGFKAWLEGPDRLNVTGVIQSLAPTWRAADGANPGGLAVTGNVKVDGNVQIHVHGNAPQITKRVFGIKVIDVKAGGGAGSSIGAKANAESPITAFLAYRAAEKAFVLQIESPAKVFAKVDIGGVPDDLERALKAGFDVPLPAGKDLYRVKLPALISEALKVTMPPNFEPATKTVKLEIETPSVELTADALVISGKVKLPD